MGAKSKYHTDVYTWIKNIIESCVNLKQCKVAAKLIVLFDNKMFYEEVYPKVRTYLIEELYLLLEDKKIQLNENIY